MQGATLLLPNSESEQKRLQQDFNINTQSIIVPNAVSSFFSPTAAVQRTANKIICVGRIEPLKNQLTLIRALNNSRYQLHLIGAAATNHRGYLQQCKKEAAENVSFLGALSRQQLLQHYQSAAVHVLPSWFETTGLSTLEAAACGCNVVIGKYGDALSYVGDAAFVCDPASPASIRQAIDAAAAAMPNEWLSAHIRQNFTWAKAAQCTLQAYHQVCKTA